MLVCLLRVSFWVDGGMRYCYEASKYVVAAKTVCFVGKQIMTY
ncbi:MAG: hypothetical protein ACKESB_02615 [Candidatus Hodgkinia cicadicola]